ncbi:hypothetical protein N7465_002864 [Penicillium sp. CMV-2018d]|nr:hypothetical protein N7465_002864 [Penicillium sp. CMV-2018d]
MEDFNSETDSDYTSYWRDWGHCAHGMENEEGLPESVPSESVCPERVCPERVCPESVPSVSRAIRGNPDS